MPHWFLTDQISFLTLDDSHPICHWGLKDESSYIFLAEKMLLANDHQDLLKTHTLTKVRWDNLCALGTSLNSFNHDCGDNGNSILWFSGKLLVHAQLEVVMFLNFSDWLVWGQPLRYQGNQDAGSQVPHQHEQVWHSVVLISETEKCENTTCRQRGPWITIPA